MWVLYEVLSRETQPLQIDWYEVVTTKNSHTPLLIDDFSQLPKFYPIFAPVRVLQNPLNSSTGERRVAVRRRQQKVSARALGSSRAQRVFTYVRYLRT